MIYCQQQSISSKISHHKKFLFLTIHVGILWCDNKFIETNGHEKMCFGRSWKSFFLTIWAEICVKHLWNGGRNSIPLLYFVHVQLIQNSPNDAWKIQQFCHFGRIKRTLTHATFHLTIFKPFLVQLIPLTLHAIHTTKTEISAHFLFVKITVKVDRKRRDSH